MGPGASILCAADGSTLNDSEGEFQDWWNRVLEPLKAKQRRSVAAITMYTTWNIWKERNKRIFDNSSLRLDQVFELIQNDVMTRQSACGTPLIREEILVS